MIWIEQAIAMGARLHVSVYPGTKSPVEVRMAFTDGSSMKTVGQSLEDALSNLEGKLLDDTAQEMIDSGAV